VDACSRGRAEPAAGVPHWGRGPPLGAGSPTGGGVPHWGHAGGIGAAEGKGLAETAHAELHTAARHVHAEDAHLHHLPDGDDRVRVAHEGVRKLGDMH
jgi:hypothetical protein